MMPQTPDTEFRFGDFTLHVTDRCLSCRGEPVPLTPKVFDTLLLLVANSGHLVEKETFLKNLWPDAFVEERSLAQNISIMRKSLGEDGNEKKYIETVPKRGYKFVAEVVGVGNGHTPIENRQILPAALHQGALPVARGLAHQTYVFLAALIVPLLLMTAYVAYRYWPSTPAPTRPTKLTRISHWYKPMKGARLSPDGRVVAFSSPVGMVQQIFVLLTAGGEPLQVTHDEGDKSLDNFSSDGREIYFQSALGQDQEWAVPTLGGIPRRVVAGCCLASSPDGGSLFYLKSHSHAVFRTVRSGSSEEKVYSFDTPPLLPLSLLPFPNGNDLLVMAVVRLSDELVRIYKVNIPSGTAVELGAVTGLLGNVAWSEPAKTLLLSRNVNGLINLWKYSLIDGKLTQVTSDPGPDLSPMPDPSTGGIYYVNGKSSGLLSVYHAHSKELVEIEPEDASQPIISPDLKRVVYIRFVGTERDELWVSNLDGTNKMRLATSSQLDTGEWAPDSSRLSFFENAGGAGTGYVVGADGNGLRSIGRFEEPIDWITWSADGKSLYVTTWKSRSGRALWKVSIDDPTAQRLLDNACTVMDASVDGQYLLGSLLWGDGTGIYQISLRDKKLIELLPDVATQPIRFAPDGKSILYAEFSRASVILYRQAWQRGQLIGKPKTALKLPFAFSAIYGGNAFDFSRDLSEIVYGHGASHDDLYLLTGAL